jgi:hypothetical protein
MSIIVDTADGQACLCGDVIYDVEAALHAQLDHRLFIVDGA